jgi:AcrR family transcriptional regulator
VSNPDPRGVPPRARRTDGRDTREHLLLTAERLFAQRGIDAVSVREILTVAGQRNKNAAQYYFGGREGLITALVTARSDALNRRREVLLDEVESSERRNDLRALCTVLVAPLAEALDDPDNHFLGFLARYQLDHSRTVLSRAVDKVHTASYWRTAKLIRATTGLPRSVFDIRFSLAMDMCFTGLAGRQAREEAGEPGLPPRTEFIDTLIDALCGVFRGP